MIKIRNNTNADIELESVGVLLPASSDTDISAPDFVIYKDAISDNQSDLYLKLQSGDVSIVNGNNVVLSFSRAQDRLLHELAINLEFDNSSNGFTANKVQTAIEEAKLSSPAQDNRGWESVVDTTYTENNPLVVNPNTLFQIPINRDSILNSELPIGVTQFWDDTANKIVPQNNDDFYIIRLTFTIKPQQNNRVLDFQLDIGGTQGVIYEDFKSLVKGAGTPSIISEVIPIFTKSTFLANAGAFYIKCNTRLEVYDLSILIIKTYDGNVK